MNCESCDGLGFVPDPHHGGSFNCEPCGGTGTGKQRPKSYAVPVKIPAEALVAPTREDWLRERYVERYGEQEVEEGQEEFYICSRHFENALAHRDRPEGRMPSADSHTERRFRMRVTFDQRPDLDGVYNVTGWLDDGMCHIRRDPCQADELGRRAAVLATRRNSEAR